MNIWKSARSWVTQSTNGNKQHTWDSTHTNGLAGSDDIYGMDPVIRNAADHCQGKRLDATWMQMIALKSQHVQLSMERSIAVMS